MKNILHTILETHQSVKNIIAWRERLIANLQPTLTSIYQQHRNVARLFGLDVYAPADESSKKQEKVKQNKRGRGRPKKEEEINVKEKMIQILIEHQKEERNITELSIRYFADKIGCSTSSVKGSRIWKAIRKQQEAEQRRGADATIQHCIGRNQTETEYRQL